MREDDGGIFAAASTAKLRFSLPLNLPWNSREAVLFLLLRSRWSNAGFGFENGDNALTVIGGSAVEVRRDEEKHRHPRASEDPTVIIDRAWVLACARMTTVVLRGVGA